MRRVILPNERSTLIVEAHGPVPMNVQYATGGGPEDSAYVLVRSPDTLIYALDARAVTAVTYSLLLARLRAGRALPAEYRPREVSFDRRVVGSVTLRGDKRIGEPGMLPADKSPNGSPHVVLKLDALTLRAYDQAAIDAYARAWIDAYQAAGDAFDKPPKASIAALLDRASQQARTPYRLDSLSSVTRQMPGSAPGRHVERSSEVRTLS